MAKELEITNGHAARMRFSRFRQHMEGSPTLARKRTSASSEPNPKRTKSSKSTKGDEKQSKAERHAKRDPDTCNVKANPGASSLERISVVPRVKPEPVVKSEPEEFSTVSSVTNAESASQEEPRSLKQEISVKAEPKEETVLETLPFESLIDPAIRDGGSMNPFLISDTHIKKEGRAQSPFAFDQHTCSRVKSKTPYPGLPFLEVLSTSEGM